MEYDKIKKQLGNDEHVKVFINYLKSLETEKDYKNNAVKNKWFSYFKAQSAIDLYKKVQIDNLYIDGEDITLQYKYGKITISYNYQAYKNKLLNVYPETTFDLQLVYDNDTFPETFTKRNGHVEYEHKIGNAFDVNRKIIGAYCVIKNKRGEFLETINQKDIAKFKAVAKTQKIWDAWPSQMILKSVVKRACKVHFKDIIVNMDKIDNENYNLENVNISPELQKEIEEAESEAELLAIYNANIETVKDKKQFTNLLTTKRNDL